MSRVEKQIEVLVLGLGNELLTDDGVGVHVVRMLQKEPPLEGILAAEVGTGILHAQYLLEQAAHVIAVDAVRAGDEPGSVYRFDIDQAQLNIPTSLHELGIVGLMQLIPEPDRPKVTIIGIEPDTIDYGMDLSPVVQKAVPGVVLIVREMTIELLSHRAGCRVGLLEKSL
jgi:hydrogenase maturation protease